MIELAAAQCKNDKEFMYQTSTFITSKFKGFTTLIQATFKDLRQCLMI